jgi:probable O-glycosylation ligase (exosortase A-associated)
VRDWVILAFVLAVLPMAMRSSFAAVFLWFWTGLISLNAFGYGLIHSIYIVQIFAVISLVAIVVRKHLPDVKATLHGFPLILMVMVAHGFLCALFAYEGVADNWYLFTNILKTALLSVMLPAFLTTRQRMNVLILGMAVAIGFHGMLDGLKFLASGGGHRAQGIPKFGDNNHYGMILVMVVPLLVYLYQYARVRLMRLISAGNLMLTVLAVIATNSRGALISLVLMSTWLLMFSRRKVMGFMVMIVVAGAGIQLAPSSWFDRMDTIQSAEQDDSFMGRVTAWKRASAIAVANPVFGGGYHAGQSWSIFEEFRYKPGLLGGVATPDVARPAASHSIYFEVMGDLGFVGLIIFIVCMTSTFYYFVRILKGVKRDPERLAWARDLAVALSSSMVTYLVGGAALSVAYYEMPYCVATAMFALNLLVNRSVSSPPRSPTARGVGAC